MIAVADVEYGGGYNDCHGGFHYCHGEVSQSVDGRVEYVGSHHDCHGRYSVQ